MPPEDKELTVQEYFREYKKALEKENMKNARMKKEAEDKMAQANTFAHK
jgi:hypothetical protein